MAMLSMAVMYVPRDYVIEINYPQQPKPISLHLPTESITVTHYGSRPTGSGDRYMGKVAACIGTIVVGIIGMIIKTLRNSASDGSEEEEDEEQAGQGGQSHIQI